MHENPILAEVLDEHVLGSVWGLDGDAEDLADRIGIRPELEAAAVLYDAEVDRAEVYDRTTWRNRLHQEWQELGPVNYILKWGAISVAASAAIVGTVATGGSTFVAGGGLKAFLGNAVVGFAIDSGIAAGATVVGYGAQETAELLAAREGRRVTGGQSPGEMFAAFQTVTAPVAIGKVLLRPTREFGKTFIKATTDTATRARSFARALAQLASDPAGAALERGRSAVATLTDLARRAAARGDATTAQRLADAATDVQRAEGNLARIEGRRAAIEALEGRGTGPQVAVSEVGGGVSVHVGEDAAAGLGTRAAVKARELVRPLARAAGEADLPYRVPKTLEVRLRRFFLTPTKYVSGKEPPILNLLNKTPGLRALKWEQGHMVLQRQWYSAGKLRPNAWFPADSLEQAGLRSMGEAGWNLMPLPRFVNQGLKDSPWIMSGIGVTTEVGGLAGSAYLGWKAPQWIYEGVGGDDDQ